MAVEVSDAGERSSADWGTEYDARRGVYQSLESKVGVLVKELLESESLDVIQIESRTKTVESFVEKLERKSVQLDPFVEVTDLVGIRVITYYQDDVERVGQVFAREFDIDAANSPALNEADPEPDHFGYRSAHYVAAIPKSRTRLAEWKRFSGLKFEIQVRTALQHAWAAVSHKVDYKSAESAPLAIRRRLYRLSALFELADEQFSILRDESARTQVAYENDVHEGNLDIPLDTESLVAYWNESMRGDGLVSLLKSMGIRVTMADGRIKPERFQRDRRDLIRVAKEVGIQTVGELDNFVSRPDLKKSAELLAMHTNSLENSLATLDDVVTQLLVVLLDETDTPGGSAYNPNYCRKLLRARDQIRRESSARDWP